MLIGVDKSTRLRSTWPGSFCLFYNFALTSMSLSEPQGGGGTLPMFGYMGAAEGLKS